MDSDRLPIKRSRTRSAEQSGQLDRSLVQKWSKEELQDRLLALYHEHSQQKEKLREQEEANKNLKLVMTKTQEKLRHCQAQSGASPADLRATDQVVKLEMRLVELEKQNAQLQSRATLKTAKAASAPAATSSPKRRGGYRAGASTARPQSRNLSSSFEAAAATDEAEMQRLRQEVESLREQLSLKDMELRESVKEANSERDTARLQASGAPLLNMRDDLDRVRLQRQLREKSAMVEQLQLRCETVEEQLRESQSANASLTRSFEQAKAAARLHDEQAAATSGNEALGQATQKRLLQMELALEDARAEAQILRESNEKLIATAFDTQKERQWRIRETELMAQIRQLEATRAAGSNSGSGAVGFSNNQRLGGDSEDLERELSTLRIRYSDLQLKQEALKERLAAIDYRKRGISDDQFQAALSLVRRQQESAELQPDDLIFLKRSNPLNADSVGDSQAQRRILELEVAHADAVAELDKARQLLKAQQQLSAETKAGHSLTESRLQEVCAEYETRIEELNRLLEIRSARIRQLEEQLASRPYAGRVAKAAELKAAPPEETEAPVRPRRQQEAQQGPPPPPPQPTAAKSSAAGSVVEEACVEQIQGVAESAYRERHKANQQRPSSAQVVRSMASRLDAPPDCRLLESEAQSSDNESVYSVVAEPIKLKPRESGPPMPTKETVKLVVDAKLRDLGAEEMLNGVSPLPLPPPYDEPSYGKPESRPRQKKQQPPSEDKPDVEANGYSKNPTMVKRGIAATTAAEVASASATVFDEQTDKDNDDKDQGIDEDAASDTDSTVVVVVDQPSMKLRLQTAPAAPVAVSRCYVQVLELHLDPNSDALANEELDETGCYVAFRLPGYDCEDTETPLTIKTPRPGVSRDAEFTLRYNFKRTYDFNFDKNYAKRRQLALEMLLSNQPAIVFSIVCEALDGSDFFLDLAKAELPLDRFIANRRPAIETLNAISNGEIIGTLKVATDLPELLRAIGKELPPSYKSQLPKCQSNMQSD